MKTWRLQGALTEAHYNLAKKLDVPPFISQLLVNRGITDFDSARQFLHGSLKDLPHPFLIKDLEKAVDRILQAIQAEEKITIYGDYDVDGTVGTSLFLLFFREINQPIHFYIPHRVREGYSLNKEALTKLRGEGTTLLITVDNGITSHEGALVARELGMDLIITDHHTVPDPMPEAYAVVNPLRRDCLFPGKEICGSGVAFYVLLGLRQKMRDCGFFKTHTEPNLKKYLDLVALATVADVVPLVGMNRVFVREGLQVLAKSHWPGLKALISVSGLSEPVRSHHLGFFLGPRINAGGRLYEAATGVKLLTAATLDEALPLAKTLNTANEERRLVEAEILQQAMEQVAADPQNKTRGALVLYHPDWHVGVIGIVASRLVDKFGRPVVMLTKDGATIKGSARSRGSLHLTKALAQCASQLIKFGGHKAAAGLTLAPENLDKFRATFEQIVQNELGNTEPELTLHVDAELTLAEIDSKILGELERLEPHGEGNPRPIFCTKGVQTQDMRIVGNNHLKFKVEKSGYKSDAIAFGWGSSLKEMSGQAVDVAFTCQENAFRGINSIVLQIRDLKKSHP